MSQEFWVHIKFILAFLFLSADSRYQEEKAEVDEYNQKIEKQFQQEKQAYENEKSSLQTEISRKRMELTNLTGLFKGKQREELNSSINMLEMRLGSLKAPTLSAPKKPVPVEPKSMVLPEQPIDSEEPVLPDRPAEEALPARRESFVKVDAVETLLKVLENKKIMIALSEVGNTIQFGRLNGTAIEWIVLDEKEDEQLIISKEALEERLYDEYDEAVTWETCTLRKYLNAEFKMKVFDNEEQKSIVKTYVVNNDNDVYGTDGGNDTEDYIFLLSIDEVNKYFENDEAREATYEGESCWWWLRSPGLHDYGAAFVLNDGSVDVTGSLVRHDLEAVRPALWIKVE